MPRNLRQRRESSSSSSSEEEANNNKQAESTESTSASIKEKIEELKFKQKQRERTHGLDVYALAIGDAAETAAKAAARRIDNDPWKSKTGGLVDMREIREKRGNEIVRHMNANFAKETNQRDEDAEMQKFIDDQLKKMRGGQDEAPGAEAASGGAGGNEEGKKFKSPNDVIFDLPKHLLESGKKKQGDGFTEETLSGIPEVDLGIDERMRNIEETEKAKSSIQQKTQAQSAQPQYHHHNNRRNDSFTSSVNFVQHKRFDETLINAEKQRAQQMAAAAALNNKNAHSDEPVVGDAPKHELLQQRPATSKRKEGGGGGGAAGASTSGGGERPPKVSRPHTGGPGARAQPTERASDDYCLERFRKNMKFSRSSKIKIA